MMDAFQQSMLKYMSELQAEIRNIKSDISVIKNDIKELKKEHDTLMSAFPQGLERHAKDHKKKKWFIF